MTEVSRLLNSVILIVDDEESIRMTFQLFLNRAGYKTVLTAGCINDALELAANNNPDLVISDIVLKDEIGTNFLRKLRKRGIDCPVVMVTGFPKLQSAAKAVRLGAFDYQAKPVNKDSLLRFTRQALTHRLLQKEREQLVLQNEQYRNYLEAVFRSVQDIMITVDPEMQIIEKNETANRWLEAHTGQTDFPENLFELDRLFRLPCLEDARKVIKTKKEVREHRVECPMKNGQSKVLSLNAAPIQDNEGHFFGVVLVARDVTLRTIEPSPSCRTQFHGYIGISPVMQEVYSLIENVGKFDTTVLISGESGTGKELASEALHAESYRKEGPLIKVDCASIPEDLLESELFGHRKGSFTGADANRSGRIQQAEKGTLFLDEIGDISSRMQLRLLRFLQERTFYPVGSDQPVSVDTRVVTATNADLKEKVQKGVFREDLYYRLRVIEIHLPPLRRRQQCIPLLAKHFLKQFQQKLGHTITGFSDQVMEPLVSHSWPGNVRELKHVIERACVLCQGTTIEKNHLPSEVTDKNLLHIDNKQTSTIMACGDNHSQTTSASATDAATEIINTLKRCGGNKTEAARLLGIDRSTLYRRMRRNHISLTDIDLR